jgi:hypothetical protein
MCGEILLVLPEVFVVTVMIGLIERRALTRQGFVVRLQLLRSFLQPPMLLLFVFRHIGLSWVATYRRHTGSIACSDGQRPVHPVEV